ncbi:tRNA (adenosine(37)-N6)-dimethylallyltransferase MiaA [Candidatus Dojkabacteria bacterium]|uniref:tRNA dimethylallyltransferase n=1 Tax=Candidatus Dojkabacteria bacterium TaxID=2099670 RepID=A0A955L3A2_9BACT|nr:tRNA (adenosine(37)-N6)-dimethylallyltransferase MiaA [Candidatus Dojkabacteria bacterium]
MNSTKQQLIVIFGPTASGKTDLSLDLAQKLGTEIINADSRQIYKYLNIGTAKPVPDDITSDEFLVKGIKHYLIDFLDPKERYNAYEFGNESKKVIAKLHQQNKIPILCGGTGLYIDVSTGRRKLQPTIINEDLRAELNQLELKDLQVKAKKVNNKQYENLNESDKNNPRRLIRLIEKTLNDSKTVPIQEEDYDVFYFCPEFDRDQLISRIEERVVEMFDSGWIEEVEELLSSGYTNQDPGLEIMGYAEILRYLDKEISKDELIELTKTAHRQYAKRQLTWMKQYQKILFAKNANQIINHLKQHPF